MRLIVLCMFMLLSLPRSQDGDLETMLHKLGQRRQFLSESEVLCMFEQICRAVEVCILFFSPTRPL